MSRISENVIWRMAFLTLSWNRAGGTAENSSDAPDFLFGIWLDLMDLDETQLQEIEINSSFTKAEAYRINNQIIGLELLIESDDPGERQAYFGQNYPNPFSNKTLLPFYLPKPEQVRFEIYNTHGQLVFSKMETFSAGHHQIHLSSQDLIHSGVYTCQITAGPIRRSFSMIRRD